MSARAVSAEKILLLLVVILLAALLLSTSCRWTFGSHTQVSVSVPPKEFDVAPIKCSLKPASEETATEETPYSKWQRDALSNLTLFRDSLFQTLIHEGSWIRPFQGPEDWPLFKPAVTCPPGRPLTRYPNRPGDGPKLLCQLNEESLTSDCLIYSLGSYGNYEFEKAMLKATKCQIHTFDCTYKGRSIHRKRHHYHKWCIGPDGPGSKVNVSGVSGPFRSWTNITQTLGHQVVHLLKVDIEGFEYPLLAGFRNGDALPSEIAVEVHVETQRQTGYWPGTAGQLALMFSHLANLGYASYSQELNPVAPHCCSEFTMIRLPVPALQ